MGDSGSLKRLQGNSISNDLAPCPIYSEGNNTFYEGEELLETTQHPTVDTIGQLISSLVRQDCCDQIRWNGN